MQHIIFGVKIDDLSPKEIQDRVSLWFDGAVPRMIVTPNAEFLLKARKDPVFANLLNRADLSVADTVTIRFAIAALTHGLLAYRNPGADLLVTLIQLAHEKRKTVLLIGGDPESAKGSAEKFKKKYPGLNIVAHDPGMIQVHNHQVEVPKETQDVINRVNPDLIVVALGQGKQEAFMHELRTSAPQSKILVGVGGALEMHSGQKMRGPQAMRSSGFEWLWRLLIEPTRFRRILNATIVFPVLVAREASREHGFFTACKRVFPEVLKQIKGL